MNSSIIKKQLLSLFLLGIFAIAVLFVNGCQVQNNPIFKHCEYIKGDITLSGSEGFGQKKYRYLKIGKYNNINTMFPKIYLLFKNGEKVFLPSIDVEWIKQKKQENKITFELERSGNEYGIHLTEYNINRCSFFFRNGNLIVFDGSIGLKAIISEKGKQYNLPISYEHLIELFGKEDYIKEYYGH